MKNLEKKMNNTNNMNNTWVCSDHHFHHANILKFQPDTRPFSNVDEMNEGIIERHNSLVKSDDEVYIIGDFAFIKDYKKVCEILDRMNGRKYFIYGNHDKIMRHPEVRKRFIWMRDYYELQVIGKRTHPIVLCHYPIYSWNRMHHGALHFYGHTHGNIPSLFTGRARDIGLDTNNCYPLNVQELIDEMSKFEVKDAREYV